jgi:hypothetical protein
MFALAWYGWVGIGLVVVVLLLVLAVRSYRAGVRRDFVAFLTEEYPDVEVIRSRFSAVDIRLGDAEGTLFLHKVYAGVADLAGKEDTPETRREVFRTFADEMLATMRESEEPLSLDRVRQRILVRLVPRNWPVRLPDGQAIPHRAVEGLGLRAVYVLDSPNSVRYLNDADLADLGLDLDGVHKLALGNLRARFSPDVVAGAVRGNSLVTVKALDSYDAARILLVPECLKDGEEIAALIPDRDTLTLVPVPADGNWRALRDLARVPASEHLLIDRPIRVTRTRFEVM